MTELLPARTRQSPDVVSVLLWILPALVYVLGFVVVYYPFVSWQEGLSFLGPYWFAAALFWSAIQRMLKNRVKTDVLLLTITVPFYFFSAWHDRMVNWFQDAPAGKYSLQLTAVAIMMVLLLLLLLRSKRKLDRLRNALLVVFIALPVFETWSIVQTIIGPKAHRRVYADDKNPWPSGQLALNNDDIYIIVVDELASSQSLQQGWGIDNFSLDNSLQQLGMQILPEARSPYFFTHFSIAAFFNQQYLTVHDPLHIMYADYLQALRAQRESFVMTCLQKQGYEILSYSPFPFTGNSVLKGSGEEPDWLGNLQRQTAFGRLRNDLGWHFPALFQGENSFQKKLAGLYRYQDSVKQSLIRSATDGHKQKRVVYGHLFLSHQPFLWDGSGHRRPALQVYADSTNPLRLQAYAANLFHVNEEIHDLVSRLLQARKGNITLIVMGDHGLRLPGTDTKNYFRPFCAVYAPHHERPLPDTVHTVNLLRMLLSNQQPAPMLPSKTIMLNDRTNFDRLK